MSPIGFCAALAVLAAAPAIAGCGSSSPAIKNVSVAPSSSGAATSRFSAAGMAIHFSYPSKFKAFALQASHTSGNTRNSSHAAVGIGSDDFLRVTRFAHRPVTVTAQNIASLKADFDRVLSQAVGQQMTSKVGTLAGRPALLWPKVVDRQLRTPVTLQIANVFVGGDEYELTCQATRANQATIDAACSRMLATLSTSP